MKCICVLFLAFLALSAKAASLDDIQVDTSASQQVLRFIFSESVAMPSQFYTKQPNRVILDFLDVQNNVSKDKKHLFNVSNEIAEIEVVASSQKLRAIITLAPSISSTLELNGQDVALLIPIKSKVSQTLPRASKEDEKVSLNFQDIETRAVLQILADFTGLNIIASEAVRGRVTLRLENVTADEALNTLLKTTHLMKKEQGKVIMIAPREEIVLQEKQERQALDEEEESLQLQDVFIPIHYAKANELALILKKENNSLLSSRGKVAVDERTNSIYLQESPTKLKLLQSLIKKLDVPVRQVLIESRIVFAREDFEQALGLKLHAGSKVEAREDLPEVTPFENRLHINLPTHLSTGMSGITHLGLAIAKLPRDTVLDLELMAMESEGLGKIVASPRLVASNQQRAYIETGEEIPYQESTSSGAASVAFRKAVLRLEVIPYITPDNQIILDLKVNQDSRGALTNGVPAINTREMHTKVQVTDGETVVLGGIYQQQRGNVQKRVPYLSKIPLLGNMFKNKAIADERNELMIFVTPKILA